MIAAFVGVAEPGALFVAAVDLADEAVDVDDQALIARAGARPPRAGERLGKDAVELADLAPNVNARRNVPSVDGATTRWPRTAAVWPERSTPQSSMQSAPSAIALIIVITLRPGFAAPARSPRSTRASTSASIPNRPASSAGSNTPAFATTRSSSNTTRPDSFTIKVAS